MKILFVITGLGVGGSETMLLQVLKRLGSRYEPSVVSLTTEGEIGEKIKRLGVPVHVFPMRPSISMFTSFCRLVKYIYRLRPDVVHTWMYHADLIGGMAAKIAGANAIAWALHNTNLDKEKTKWMTRLVVRCNARLSSWLPDRILSCSATAINVHASRGYAEDKMLFIPNGIDTERFRPKADARESLRKELDIPEGAALVGLVGRDDPLKNHAGFLEIAAEIHRKMPHVYFLLAGEGVDTNNAPLWRKVVSGGLEGVVRLLGHRDDMPHVMAALDILASTSHGEAFPLVLGEAMACGVPCVATDVGDCAYIIGDTGTVVPAGDMATFASALEAMLKLPRSLRAALGEKARRRVASHFEIGHVVRLYQEAYESLRGNAH